VFFIYARYPMMTTSFPDLKGRGPIAFDCETTGLNPRRGATIAGVAVAVDGWSGYFPVAHENGPNLDKRKVYAWLNKQLKLPVPKIGARLIFDLEMLAAEGVNAVGPFYDVQVAEPLIDETRLRYNLESIAQHHLKTGKLGEPMEQWIVEHLKVKPSKVMEHVWRAPPSVVAPYAEGDVKLPLRIFTKQQPMLQQLGLWNLFLMESKLIPMLLAMRQRGVRVDLDRAEQLKRQMAKEQVTIERKIKQQTGIKIELWAARSLAKIFDKLGLEYSLTEKTEAPSFRQEFLYHHPHPITGLIRRARQLDKLRSTFIESAILDSNIDGRIHCHFNQLRSDAGGTVSGRLSSSKPNLQQVPVRGELGKSIRSIFVPELGEEWHKHDFNQIEYRLMVNDAAEFELKGADDVVALYVNDPSTDFHQAVANMTGLERAAAKTVNFGIAYGEGVTKLCRDLGLDRDEGEKLLRTYHRNAPFMRPLMNYWMDRAETDPFEIRTLFNRRRQFNKWMLKRNDKISILDHCVPGSERAFTYSALNARIQGSAADIFKASMAKIWESGVCDVVGVPLLLVHDEFDWSVPKTKKAREAMKEIKHIMEHVVDLSIPLVAEASSGQNWGDCA